MRPKPDIMISQDEQDPEYRATRRHFAQLFRKFGWPITCINLTKKKNAREQPVAALYNEFVNTQINDELPREMKINFHHYDLKAQKKLEANFPEGLF